MRNKLITFCIAILILFTLCGCGSNSIVGTWKSELGGITYTFDKDGTGVQSSDFVEGSPFKYTTKDDILTITESQGGIEVVQEYYYKIEDGQLKLAVKTDSNERYYIVYTKTDGNDDQTEQTSISDDELILGYWKSSVTEYMFNDDGTGYAADPETGLIFASFEYELKDNYLHTVATVNGQEVISDDKYEFKDNKLYLTGDVNGENQTIEFTKDEIEYSNDTSDTNSTINTSNTSDKELLIGQWDGQGYSYVFNEDSTGLTYGAGGAVTSSFTYEVENGHIYFTESEGGIESVEDYIYQLDGDTLKIAVNTDSSTKFFFTLIKSSD